MDGKWKTIPHLRTKHAKSTCCFEVVGHNSLCKLLSSGSWQNPAVFFTKSLWFPCRDRVSLTCTTFRCHYSSNYGTCSYEEPPGFLKTFMSSCPVAKARVIPAAAKVADREDVLISDALKLALWTYAGLSIMVTTALEIRP